MPFTERRKAEETGFGGWKGVKSLGLFSFTVEDVLCNSKWRGQAGGWLCKSGVHRSELQVSAEIFTFKEMRSPRGKCMERRGQDQVWRHPHTYSEEESILVT